MDTMTEHDSFIIEIHSVPVQFRFGRHELSTYVWVQFWVYYLDTCYGDFLCDTGISKDKATNNFVQ